MRCGARCPMAFDCAYASYAPLRNSLSHSTVEHFEWQTKGKLYLVCSMRTTFASYEPASLLGPVEWGGGAAGVELMRPWSRAGQKKSIC